MALFFDKCSLRYRPHLRPLWAIRSSCGRCRFLQFSICSDGRSACLRFCIARQVPCWLWLWRLLVFAKPSACLLLLLPFSAEKRWEGDTIMSFLSLLETRYGGRWTVSWREKRGGRIVCMLEYGSCWPIDICRWKDGEESGRRQEDAMSLVWWRTSEPQKGFSPICLLTFINYQFIIKFNRTQHS